MRSIDVPFYDDGTQQRAAERASLAEDVSCALRRGGPSRARVEARQSVRARERSRARPRDREMATLEAGVQYGLRSNFNENKNLLFVKLTDSAHRQILSYVKNRVSDLYRAIRVSSSLTSRERLRSSALRARASERVSERANE